MLIVEDDARDEILLASRLETVKGLDMDEEVDLLGLASEECARYDAIELEGLHRGLGLALVGQIARRHGGDARYLGREQAGSCFVVSL